MEYLKQALSLRGELDKLKPIPKDLELKIAQKFRLDWDYHSNHLEGNSLTYGETMMLILRDHVAPGKPLKDHEEIIGHDEAVKLVENLVEEKRPLTENLIREIHVLLLKKAYWGNAVTPDGKPTKKLLEVGKYKTLPNHVITKTGEIFRYATPEETPAKMHDLLLWYRKESERADVNPIILASEIHYRFVRIHPFDDGNGRLSRILMNLTLMRFGFPPVIIRTEDRENYFNALSQADVGMIEKFIDYIAKNLVRSLEISIAGAKGENIEEPDDLDKKISLLEKRFKRDGSGIAVTKTAKAVQEIYDDSVARVWQKFIESCKKFDGFYLRKQCWLCCNTIARDNVAHAILDVRKHIDENTNFVGLTCKFEFLNRQNSEINFGSEIEFKFGLESYSFESLPNHKTITKNYDEQLSDEEISEVIKLETERHFRAIEDKLKNDQKN
jgi:Fic family protein